MVRLDTESRGGVGSAQGGVLMALVDGAAYQRAMAEVARLNDENERLSFDYERLASRKLTDEVDALKQWQTEMLAFLFRVSIGMTPEDSRVLDDLRERAER